MKNLVIMTHDMHGGGCERVISQLANWFVERNIECTIITEVKGPVFYKLNSKVKLISLSSYEKLYPQHLISTYLKLRKVVKKIKPDVILSMPEKVNVWTALALLGTRFPVVVSERNNPNLYPPSKVKRFLRKIIYPFVDGFIFQTKQAKEYFPKYIQKKGIVLPNPLDLNRIPHVFGRKRKEIVSIGRLEKQKNFYLLIDAFSDFQKKITGYKLKIYGEGSLREDLEEYAKQKLLNDTYEFPGKKTEVLEEISNASMFVLSSDYEGMPNALIEAMALGLPVISTNCPIYGPGALIENGDNGILVPVRDKLSLVNSMCYLVENETFANKIGGKAKLIRKELCIDKVGNNWYKYLESVSKNRNKKL